MNIVETAVVLAKIQAFDNRNVGDETTLAWQEILAPHILPDCLAAVTDYYKANSAWIMPSHVVERVRAMEEDRVRHFKNGCHLNRADEERALEGSDWSAAMRRLHRAAATGALTPEAYEAYLDSEQPIEGFLGRKEIGQ